MTSQPSVFISAKVDWQKFTSVMITAIEGGSSYWLCAAYKPDSVDASRFAGTGPWYARKGYWMATDIITEFHELTDEVEGTFDTHQVGFDQLVTGLANLARLRPDLVAYMAEEPPGANLDLIADAEQADSIMQIIVLGEIRYG